MRVLFFLRHNGFVRNFEWMLRAMAERGDHLELAFQFERGEAEIPLRLAAEYPNVTISRAPRRNDLWLYVAYRLRYAIDYLRYLRPEYAHAPKLRARGRRRAPRALVRLTRLGPLRSARGLARLDSTLRALESSIPRSKTLEAFVSERRPDVVLVTPLVDGPWQEDYVSAANALGIPTALLVASWDNLTNKGVIRVPPDRIYVWNEVQRREAIHLHGIAPEHVVAVGAHSYDHWFRWAPSTTREDFCARVGLRHDRPILLYLCSSGFVAEDIESEIVAEWVAALRSSGDAVLREASVLVRPHFRALATWDGDPLAGWENVAVWPRGGADPRTPDAKRDYFDSLYHSAATIGANTTALIEAAIVGRRSFTFLHPRLRETQEGTLHFHYLVRENGGPLEAAASIDEHLTALAEALRRDSEPDWSHRFLESFVRPRGLDVDAAPILVDEVARLAQVQPATARTATGRGVLLRAILLPLALLSNAGRGTRLWKSLFPRDVTRDVGAGRNTSGRGEWTGQVGQSKGGYVARRSMRRVARRMFYRTVHALLPRAIREPLRKAIRGPRPNPEELEAQRRAGKLGRRQARHAAKRDASDSVKTAAK